MALLPRRKRKQQQKAYDKAMADQAALLEEQERIARHRTTEGVGFSSGPNIELGFMDEEEEEEMMGMYSSLGGLYL